MSSGRSLRGEDQDQEGDFFRDWWWGGSGGKRGAGSEGQRSLFLFQLDRIGTQAQGEETQRILSCDDRGRCD